MWPCNLSIEVYSRLRAKYVYYLFSQEYIDYLHCVGLFFLALRFDTKLMVGNLKQSYIRHEDFLCSDLVPPSWILKWVVLESSG